MDAVTYHDMLALRENFETGLLERADCPEMMNTRNPRHR